MFYTYVIKSKIRDNYYKGHCENLAQRISQHNSGMTKSLVPFVPFELVYFETFNTRIEAIEREKYFKSAAGRRFLKKKTENGPVVQCLPDCGIQVSPPDYVIQAGPPVPNEILEWLVVFNMMLIS